MTTDIRITDLAAAYKHGQVRCLQICDDALDAYFGDDRSFHAWVFGELPDECGRFWTLSSFSPDDPSYKAGWLYASNWIRRAYYLVELNLAEYIKAHNYLPQCSEWVQASLPYFKWVLPPVEDDLAGLYDEILRRLLTFVWMSDTYDIYGVREA